MGIHIRSDRCFECGEKITADNSFACNNCSEDICRDCVGASVHSHNEDLYHGGVREEE